MIEIKDYNFQEDDYLELECPFCKQDHFFNYKLEHFDDCPNIGLHHKEYRARAFLWVKRMIYEEFSQKK